LSGRRPSWSITPPPKPPLIPTSPLPPTAALRQTVPASTAGN
jgi:hypothetical protein